MAVTHILYRQFFQLHGTYRQRDRVYHEDVFWGNGKSLKEASPEELAQDMKERTSENPLAYQGNQLVNALSEEEIQSIGNGINEKKKLWEDRHLVSEKNQSYNTLKKAQKNIANFDTKMWAMVICFQYRDSGL